MTSIPLSNDYYQSNQPLAPDILMTMTKTKTKTKGYNHHRSNNHVKGHTNYPKRNSNRLLTEGNPAKRGSENKIPTKEYNLKKGNSVKHRSFVADPANKGPNMILPIPPKIINCSANREYLLPRPKPNTISSIPPI